MRAFFAVPGFVAAGGWSAATPTAAAPARAPWRKPRRFIDLSFLRGCVFACGNRSIFPAVDGRNDNLPRFFQPRASGEREPRARQKLAAKRKYPRHYWRGLGGKEVDEEPAKVGVRLRGAREASSRGQLE